MVNMLKVLIAVIVLLAIIGLALLGKKIFRTLIFKTAKTPNNESTWLMIMTGLVTVGIAIAYYVNNDPAADPVMWTGLVIFFLGGLLQIIARRQLHEDKTFEERLSSGFEAAQTGIYSVLRHPNKTALLLIVIGFSMIMGSIWALALAIILFFPSVLYRISQEEAVLLDKFGDRWLDYKSETKRIIPKIL
ncbi:Phospholipid methyltransferase [uncultured archaeon]|nr:Phospholipid methyltransferase [uncultured archaeon]